MFVGIEMTPILRKSKEAGKHVVKSSRYHDKRPIGSSRFLRRGGRGRKLFLTSRSRLASLARGSQDIAGNHRSSRDHSYRYTPWFSRGDSPYTKYDYSIINYWWHLKLYNEQVIFKKFFNIIMLQFNVNNLKLIILHIRKLKLVSYKGKYKS